MESPDRVAADRLALQQALAERPYAFDFFQALRRLECTHPDKPRIGEARNPKDEPIRFGQEASVSFAPSTVAALEPGHKGFPPRLIFRFFGLFGPNGALPTHLTEYARDRMLNHGDPTFVRFLDLFHHRLISLFYRAWATAQPTVSLDRSDRDRFRGYVGATIGLSLEAMRGRDSVPDSAKLAAAGLLSRHVKNAGGLQAILARFFQATVRVEEYVGHWMELPEECYSRLRCDPGATLGHDAVIGERVWNLQTKFRIVIGPLSLERYERLLPSGRSFRALMDWVRNYLGFEMKWDCRLILKQDEVPPLLLGYTGRLGWTTWLGVRLGGTDADDLVLSGSNRPRRYTEMEQAGAAA